MPEPTDPLRERLAAVPGLATLVADARAMWLARAERAAMGTPATRGVSRSAAAGPSSDARSSEARSSESVGTRRSSARRVTPRWRAFEDAFPTFYQFTNRPR